MEEEFNEGNVVWVKLKGYPWWPGIVRINKIIKNKYLIYF
jgi:hypothetical protein